MTDGQSDMFEISPGNSKPVNDLTVFDLLEASEYETAQGNSVMASVHASMAGILMRRNVRRFGDLDDQRANVGLVGPPRQVVTSDGTLVALADRTGAVTLTVSCDGVLTMRLNDLVSLAEVLRGDFAALRGGDVDDPLG
ncbi:hypothetical protein FOS14_09020 [Skermania sp. ID1734]|uniref:hypothetical protein n=1 Tax=Skermania sp. ID1734 TaxID=2597516 RepID=UPI00118009A9|nr:hypothetical protein [Skermania sp. ID1734]TSD99964.1 hypothetical protein FOS14_09020 [Skermania sp. ID1734]